MIATTIERARSSDAAAILRVVGENRLPLAGLESHLATALVARLHDRLVGTAALEVYADGALLRSVAVAVDFHGHGVGRQLTAAAIDLAKQIGSPAVYLLTTTAEEFFPRFGFERIARDEVPAAVRTSIEFTSACPASAVVMRKSIS